MLRFIKQFLLTFLSTLAYASIGAWLALPLSYFFQGDIYSQMTFLEYVSAGRDVVLIGADFGALNVYRYCLMASVITCVFIGKFIEKQLTKQ
ncbi:MAG: hypothetical protein KGV56_05880 [Gammaproteobacteria bacterium]|nr:hypothetical protein [Gammaproteobacteria bacterium]MBS9782009.1 hypothetical protein [Gammaproteobacteria bacterium]